MTSSFSSTIGAETGEAGIDSSCSGTSLISLSIPNSGPKPSSSIGSS